MRHTLPALVLALSAMLAVPAAAQEFTGTGQRATELFPLPQGLSVFEIEHRGSSGAFIVQLFDDTGTLVGELARANGTFQGSKAIPVPRTGNYVLDVAATGPWSVRRRGGPAAPVGAAINTDQGPEHLAGIADGNEAAAGPPVRGWFARGLLGGVVGGPIGTAVAVNFAGRSDATIPPPMRGDNANADYTLGYQAGYTDRLHQRRKKSALAGGIVGSAVFLGVLVYALDIVGAGDGSRTGTQPPPGGQVILIPLRP